MRKDIREGMSPLDPKRQWVKPYGDGSLSDHEQKLADEKKEREKSKPEPEPKKKVKPKSKSRR